ncbi:venom serine carboxypeptidase-like [Octopus sinensis]|uniref:Venom serine carboxypeptidase-like n=1 Tax=Octopus sinensis TaxID=2607531 RepID=A0A6P7TYH6_9MOLL|nr:venom serine carboxypeptidase-like [Octopus sinensis]
MVRAFASSRDIGHENVVRVYNEITRTTRTKSYYFQNGNKSAPILVWLQGGPGESSMYGLFLENGPYYVDSDYKGNFDEFIHSMMNFGTYFYNIGLIFDNQIFQFDEYRDLIRQSIDAGKYQDATNVHFVTILTLIYSGQLDVIVPYPMTSSFLKKMDWAGQEEFHSAPQQIWYSQDKTRVNGYVRSARNLKQILVRDAGHMVAEDQPKAGLEMIRNFIFDINY